MLLFGKIVEQGIVRHPDVVMAIWLFDRAAHQNAKEDERWPTVPDRRGRKERQRLLKDHPEEIAKLRNTGWHSNENAAEEWGKEPWRPDAVKRLFAAAEAEEQSP
jgi:hypothetical protein